MTHASLTCAFCDHAAHDLCPRCDRPRCEAHGVGKLDSSWPKSGYNEIVLCPDCVRSSKKRSRKAARVSVSASAAVVGMAVGALTTMLIGGALGLGADLIVLCMLLAEVGVGGLSAYAADKRMQRWLLERDQRHLDTDLPEARLLES